MEHERQAAGEGRQVRRKRGIDPEEVPVKTLFPLLEKASLEDPADDDMIERWANLLTASADATAGEVPPTFAEILGQLTRGQARLLDGLYDAATAVPREHRWYRGSACASGMPTIRLSVSAARWILNASTSMVWRRHRRPATSTRRQAALPALTRPAPAA